MQRLAESEIFVACLTPQYLGEKKARAGGREVRRVRVGGKDEEGGREKEGGGWGGRKGQGAEGGEREDQDNSSRCRCCYPAADTVCLSPRTLARRVLHDRFRFWVLAFSALGLGVGLPALSLTLKKKKPTTCVARR